MTPKETIERIDDILSADVHYDESIEYQLTTDDVDWLEEAKKVLEKRISQKVIEQTEEDREFIDFVCPSCKTTLQQKIKTCFSQRYFKNTIYKYKFCLHCGQALDWSDTE